METGTEGNSTAVGVDLEDTDAFIRSAFIIGSPDEVVEGIQAYAGAGINHLACHFYFGMADRRVTEKSFNRFVADVMPRFAES